MFDCLDKYSRSSAALIFLIGASLVHGNAYGQKAPSGQKCATGAWTGSIVYRRTQSMSEGDTIERVSARGKDNRHVEMYHDYRAVVAVVPDPQQPNSSIGKATVEHIMSSKETTVAKEKNSCDQGKTWQEMTGTFEREQVTRGSGQDVANVRIAVNDDGTYSVGVSAPSIRGVTTGSEKASYSGQCTTKEGKSITYPGMEAAIQGGSLTSDGRHRVDPDQPNRLSGSYSQSFANLTQTITWNLQKCAAPLRLTDITFEHMDFPNWGQWREIVEQIGTIDGNLVRIKATVLNESADHRNAEVVFKETYRGDRWDGAKPDKPLKDQVISVSLAPGEAKEVEMLWDSSGYSWYDDGRPRLVQRIRAELVEKNKVVDSLVENLKVAPKPLVLVHGAWTSWTIFESWQNLLTTTHSYDWKAFAVGEKADKGVINAGRNILSAESTNTVAQNAEELQRYIAYAQEDRNAWHVDVVGHSMGGIIARHYIDRLMPPANQDGRPQIAHLLMIGTPNLGSPCADVMDFALDMVGKSPHAVLEMRQDTMATFNRQVTNRKGVKFSTLAGNPMPTMCKTIVWNDGFVPVPSALWTIADHAESDNLHLDLLGAKEFSTFVKPRVAIGPGGNHMPDVPSVKGAALDGADRYMGATFMNAAFGLAAMAAATSEDLKPDFAKAVTLAAKQSLEIDIPVQQALNFGVTFIAAKEVTATLMDDTGAMVAKNLAGTPEANAAFRSLFVDKPTKNGTWKLRLENTGTQQAEALIAAWKNAAKPGAKKDLVAMN